MVRRKHIRSVAERLLADTPAGSAPIPLKEIVKSLGVEIHQEAVEDDLSGFLYRDHKRNLTIIGVNADHPPNRKKFTIAHELGHYLLHDFDDVHVDRQFKVWLRNETSSQGTDDEEKEANLFAAEILMPARFIEADVQQIGNFDLLNEKVIEDLAKRYGVSSQAMTFRLAYLGYVHG